MSVTITGLANMCERIDAPIANRIPGNWLQLLVLKAEQNGCKQISLDVMCPTDLLPLPVLREDGTTSFVLPDILRPS